MVDLLKTNFDPIERIWSGGKPAPMFDVNCSIGRIIHNNLKNNPKNICQICVEDGKTATNQDILSWSVRLAQHLKQRGLSHDDVVGISAKNSTYVTPAVVACFFNATPFHAVNPNYDVKTLTHVLTITKPKLIFCDALDYDKLKSASAAWNPEFITVAGKVEGVTYVEELLSPTMTEMFYQTQPLVLGGDQTVVILCSSGTTGLPKAVCMANSIFDCSNPLITSESIAYCATGVDWYTGTVFCLWSVANGCIRILSNKPFTPEYFLDLVEKYKITIALFAPIYASALASCPKASPDRLASVVCISVTGGWIPSETLQKLQGVLKKGFILSVYGTTEFGRITCSVYTKEVGNSAGKLMSGVNVRIVDENGENLSHGQSGEIYVNIGHKWSGYYGNVQESQSLQDPQGWFHTGDIGYFDVDNNLYVVDRKKEIFKCLTMHYWPNEIESAIAELPDVQQVCVVGIYDEKYGDAPAAMVVKQPGSSLSADQIKEHVAKRMVVEYKQLFGGVYFADELPHSPNGKVLRQVVKEKLTQAYLDR